MDFVKSAIGGGDNNNKGGNTEGGGRGGGFMDGIGEKLNSAAGGGKESEKNEDLLDKGVCVLFCYFYLLDQIFCLFGSFWCFLHLPYSNAILFANPSPSLCPSSRLYMISRMCGDGMT